VKRFSFQPSFSPFFEEFSDSPHYSGAIPFSPGVGITEVFFPYGHSSLSLSPGPQNPDEARELLPPSIPLLYPRSLVYLGAQFTLVLTPQASSP